MAHVNPKLVREIQQGNCVAFVGAGFSVPAVGTWAQLLTRLATEVGKNDPKLLERVNRRLSPTDPPKSPPRAHDYEAAAQLIRDVFGRDAASKGDGRFEAALLKAVERNGSGSLEQRLHLLKGIPFRAIVTTNFDPYLQAEHLQADQYGEAKAWENLLRGSPDRWWNERFTGTSPKGAAVVKLHGDLAGTPPSAIFSVQDYRSRLYKDTGYLTFLRSVLATRTVLYLGFSFTDAYLNELRSEVLAMFGARRSDIPLAYALVADANEDDVQHFLDHERIQLIPYTADPAHSGFDDFLHDLNQETSPQAILEQLVRSKRILWVDPNGENNALGAQVFRSAAAAAGVGTLVQVDTAEELEHRLEAADSPYDLVLTCWGHNKEPEGATAERVLRAVHRSARSAPVIVFSNPKSVQTNRPKALSLGAFAIVGQWHELFEEIERLFRGTQVRS